MINLKRGSIAAAAVLALSAGLAGCGANSEDAASAETTPSVSHAADTAKATPSTETEPSGKASPPSSTEPSETPSPSGPYEPATPKHPARNVPAPGPLPEIAKEKNKVGQLAFAEHWFKEVNYAWETGGFRDEFWEITSRDCEYCQAAEKTFARMKKHNAWIVGGYIHHENIHAPNKKLDDGTYYVTFTTREEERVFYTADKTTSVGTTSAGQTDSGLLILKRKNDGWEVQGVYGAEN